MRYRSTATNHLKTLVCLGLLCFSSSGLAQVYKSYDAEGNVVFSDKPSDGSSEIEVRQPNLSESIEVPPPSTTPSEPKTEAKPTPEPPPVVEEESADTNNDGRISRREKEKFREEQRRKKREAREAAEGKEE